MGVGYDSNIIDFNSAAARVERDSGGDQLSVDFDSAKIACSSLLGYLDQQKTPLPFVCAIMYVLDRAASGVTMDTFKPLVKGSDYVGAERRAIGRTDSVHRHSASIS